MCGHRPSWLSIKSYSLFSLVTSLVNMHNEFYVIDSSVAQSNQKERFNSDLNSVFGMYTSSARVFSLMNLEIARLFHLHDSISYRRIIRYTLTT